MAVGTADMTLTVYSTFTLLPVMRLPNIHGFPLTCITFSPSDKTIVTGSADGTFCVCRMSPSGGKARSFVVLLFYLYLWRTHIRVSLRIILFRLDHFNPSWYLDHVGGLICIRHAK